MVGATAIGELCNTNTNTNTNKFILRNKAHIHASVHM